MSDATFRLPILDDRAKLSLDIAKVQASKRMAAEGFSPRGMTERMHKGEDYARLVFKVCESPIEAIMVGMLIFGDWHGFQDVTPVPVFMQWADEPAPDSDILLVPQMQFMRYRADFGIICRLPGRVATKTFFVECDGAAFHQDGMRDLVRDQYLHALGVTTIRATGSEINADPAGAAQRVIAQVTAWKDGLSEARAA